MAIPTLDQYTITALAEIFREAKSAKEFSDVLEELERREKMFTAQRDALEAIIEKMEIEQTFFQTGLSSTEHRNNLIINARQALGKEE